MLGLCELSLLLFHPLISDPAKILIKFLIKFLQLELCPGWEVQGADPGALPTEMKGAGMQLELGLRQGMLSMALPRE